MNAARYEWIVENAPLGHFANDGTDRLAERLAEIDALGFELVTILSVKYQTGPWAKIVARRPRQVGV